MGTVRYALEQWRTQDSILRRICITEGPRGATVHAASGQVICGMGSGRTVGQAMRECAEKMSLDM